MNQTAWLMITTNQPATQIAWLMMITTNQPTNQTAWLMITSYIEYYSS